MGRDVADKHGRQEPQVNRRERINAHPHNEPDWTGNGDLSEDERELWREYERIMALPPEHMAPEFPRTPACRKCYSPCHDAQ